MASFVCSSRPFETSLPQVELLLSFHPSVMSQALVQELNFSAYLGLPAFMIPLKGPHCANLARVLLNHIQTGHHSCMVATAVKHYLSVPFKNNNSFLILGLCCDWQFHGISVNLKLKL